MDVQGLTKIIESWGVLLIPLTTGIVEVIKRAIPEKYRQYTPFVSIVVGIILGILTIGISQAGIIAGIVVGLGASGLWSAVKAPTK